MNASAINAWQVLRDAWHYRARLGESRYAESQLNFLPAALEIQETPPSPVGRLIGVSIITLMVVGVMWAVLGKVDIVAVAEGKIVPSHQVKVIQPYEKGMVTRVWVEEGQHVKAGDALVELDQTLTQADQQRLSQELYAKQLELARYKTLQTWLETGTATPALLDAPSLSSTVDIQLQQQLAHQQWQQYQAQRGALINALQQHQAEKNTSQHLITKLQQTLPLITQRTQAVKTLLDKEMASQMQYWELEEQRIQQTQDLAAEQSRQQQLQAAIDAAQKQIQALEHETQSSQLTAIAESQRKIADLQEELNKAKDLNAKQVLYAPVDGTVQQLVINTIGGVVTPAQPLMQLVPHNEKLLVEAFLENKDIGFVQEGQAAEIKVQTFPFTKYGVINATVQTVSPDAIADEKQGLRYKVRLLMTQSTLQVDERVVELMPGMAVTAEVKTGKRRIIEFVTAPLMQHGQESGRER